MTDFEKWASGAINSANARTQARAEAALGVMLAVVLGVLGALGLWHCWAA